MEWVNQGWIDYCVPQIYWEIGHKSADYKTLIEWWNKYAGNRPLFIGEDIERTVKNADPANPNNHQMGAKFAMHDQLSNVNGTVLWYAKAAVDNVGNYGTNLRKHYWNTPALQPLMPFIDDTAPGKPRKVKAAWTQHGYMLKWEAPKASKWNDEVTKYVVYKFAPKETIDTEDASKILMVTTNTQLILPYEDGKTKYTYVITALDRMSNESKAVKKKVKL